MQNCTVEEPVLHKIDGTCIRVQLQHFSHSCRHIITSGIRSGHENCQNGDSKVCLWQLTFVPLKGLSLLDVQAPNSTGTTINILHKVEVYFQTLTSLLQHSSSQSKLANCNYFTFDLLAVITLLYLMKTFRESEPRNSLEKMSHLKECVCHGSSRTRSKLENCDHG